MGVLLQGFYKMLPNNAVPSPKDGDGTNHFWWDVLAAEAHSLRRAGFTAIWLPPVLKTASGSGPGADGYGPYDDYDIGSRNQKGSIETRFGSREQLQRCIAILRANDLDVYLDMVEHHRSGDTVPFVFRYPGADGAVDSGRFPKSPTNFIPQVPRDPNLGGPPADDFPFGRELAPINAKPPHYVFGNLVDAADWLTRALDIQGYRIDDVKGLSTDFLRPFLDSKSMAGKFAVGEFFDGNRTLVNGWIFNVTGMDGRSSAFDFPLKFVLNAMCSKPGRFNMADLDHVGLAGISPSNAVTFVENHDTDLSDQDKIVSNKILAYAYILTSEGYPCVYYRDYSTGPNGYGLQPRIDNLIWIHENLAAGPTEQRWKDFNVFAFERVGGPRLLVGLNNDPENTRVITVSTGFGPNAALHDYTGHGPDVVTDREGNVTITVPHNNDGTGYVCYSRPGLGGDFVITPRSVTQDFEGAADLDIPPATLGTPVSIGRVWCEQNTPLEALLTPDTTDWTDSTSIVVEVIAPDGNVLAQQSVTLQTPAKTSLKTTIQSTGAHILRISAFGTPPTNPNPPFKLTVTYMAPTQFDPTAVPAAAPADITANLAKVGQWSKIIPLANVPIHAHVLPTGKVLFWGRRSPAGTTTATSIFASLNQHSTDAFVWNPQTPQQPGVPTSNQPTNLRGETINLFCSGHTFLPDGRLLVTGGHLFDSQGISSSTFYDPFTNQWSPGPDMDPNNLGMGRWYPTAITLADGRPLVLGGSHAIGPAASPPNNPPTAHTVIPQVLDNGQWISVTDFQNLPLYPRIHIAPNGFLFMSGPLSNTYYLKNFLAPNSNAWSPIAVRSAGIRDYAPSVMYDVGKVIFIGGGLDPDPNDNSQDGPPTQIAEIIDLTSANPTWSRTGDMNFPRRQHNATILPDGTVLVTGGSKGTGFDNLNPGNPVHQAELWDPATNKWTVMASEDVDRCYHSTAVLLPDGRVFSGGGGEYAPDNQIASNAPKDTHPDCQIFSPPYLFKKAARPSITNAPDRVQYGEQFVVATPSPGDISVVSWIRLPSVTHSFDQNQRINFLPFQVGGANLSVTAPPNANECPPGHYMLFILDKDKVPSVARIVQIVAPVVAAAAAPHLLASGLQIQFKNQPEEELTTEHRDREIQQNEPLPPVVVGVTPICPYGLSACWAGAYEGLQNLSGVRLVRPLPDSQDSTAFVYLEDDRLPDLEAWPSEFAEVANAVHRIRGVEITISGLVRDLGNDAVVLEQEGPRPSLLLQPILPEDKIQWAASESAPQLLTFDEGQAYKNLQAKIQNAGGSIEAIVTGPLQKSGAGYILKVRVFQA